MVDIPGLQEGDRVNISKAEFNELKKLKGERDAGRVLTPDGLRVICESFDNDPEQIGKHFLTVLQKFIDKKII